MRCIAFVVCTLLLLGTLTQAKDTPKVCHGYMVLEKEAHCGPHGYLIGYGKKYCLRFHDPEYTNAFDTAGLTFIDCTTKCLLNAIKRIVATAESCDLIGDDAFASHAECYLTCGFCNICKTNKAALLGTYDYKDFLSLRALKQVYAVMKICGPLACFTDAKIDTEEAEAVAVGYFL